MFDHSDNEHGGQNLIWEDRHTLLGWQLVWIGHAVSHTAETGFDLL